MQLKKKKFELVTNFYKWKSNISDCMAKQNQCFCGQQGHLDPIEGEVKSEVFDGPFLKLFPVNNLSTQSEHQKSF